MVAKGRKSVVMIQKRKQKNKRMRLSTKVTAPSAGGVIVRRGVNPPRIISQGMSTFVRNTELLSTVGTAALGAFGNARGNLIAGNLTWLSVLAQGFNKWRWHFVKLIYIPTVPSTTLGQVVLSFGYDVVDTQPTTLVQAQQAYNSVNCPVWAGFDGSSDLNRYTRDRSPGSVSLQLDCNRLGGATGDNYYRFTTNVTLATFSAQERNIYVPAFVDISTANGAAAAGSVGNLFIEYEVELVEPVAQVLNL